MVCDVIRRGALCAFVVLAIGCGGEVSPRAQDAATPTAREETGMTLLLHTTGKGPPAPPVH